MVDELGSELVDGMPGGTKKEKTEEEGTKKEKTEEEGTKKEKTEEGKRREKRRKATGSSGTREARSWSVPMVAGGGSRRRDPLHASRSAVQIQTKVTEGTKKGKSRGRRNERGGRSPTNGGMEWRTQPVGGGAALGATTAQWWWWDERVWAARGRRGAGVARCGGLASSRVAPSHKWGTLARKRWTRGREETWRRGRRPAVEWCSGRKRRRAVTAAGTRNEGEEEWRAMVEVRGERRERWPAK